MCGPLVASVGARRAAHARRRAARSRASSLYHAGRITTYATIGALDGAHRLLREHRRAAGRAAGRRLGRSPARSWSLMGLGAAGLVPAARRLEARASAGASSAPCAGSSTAAAPGGSTRSGSSLRPPPLRPLLVGLPRRGGDRRACREGLLLALAFGARHRPGAPPRRRRRGALVGARAPRRPLPRGRRRSSRCSGLVVPARAGSGAPCSACDHCLLELPASARRSARGRGEARVFCCAGCRGVFRARLGRGARALTTQRRRWDEPGAPATDPARPVDAAPSARRCARSRAAGRARASTSTGSAAPPASG